MFYSISIKLTLRISKIEGIACIYTTGIQTIPLVLPDEFFDALKAACLAALLAAAAAVALLADEMEAEEVAVK